MPKKAGLPPLPRPAAPPVTEQVELTLPGALWADLTAAANAGRLEIDQAVAMCVVLRGDRELPAAPLDDVVTTMDLTLPGDVMAELRSVVKSRGISLSTGVRLCVQLWRNGAPSARRQRVVKRNKPRANARKEK